MRPDGTYTGALGSEVRWVPRADLVTVVKLTDCPEPLRPELSEKQADALARALRQADKADETPAKPKRSPA